MFNLVDVAYQKSDGGGAVLPIPQLLPQNSGRTCKIGKILLKGSKIQANNLCSPPPPTSLKWSRTHMVVDCNVYKVSSSHSHPSEKKRKRHCAIFKHNHCMQIK